MDSKLSALDIPDATRFFEEQQKNEAFKALFPHPNEQRSRINLITILHGRAPNMYSILKAQVQLEGLQALREGRTMNWSRLEPIEYLLTHAPSLNGTRASQAVEIAKSSSVEVPPTLTERVFGRRH